MCLGISVCCKELTKSYDRGLVQALTGLGLMVTSGERVAIMGPTGCGKSTLLSLIALLDDPDSGELRLNDVPASAIGSPERWRAGHLGIVFQFHHLLPHLTVAENVVLPLLGSSRQTHRPLERAQQILAELCLDHRARTLASKLSGGERQLASVARALVNEPRLILADEPTGNVDSATGERILNLLFGWSNAHASTLILVTHDPEVAGRADRTVFMRDGRVVKGQLLATQP